MAIQISGCTVIDNSRNITNANNMCVGTGITMIGSSGNISIAGTLTAGGLDFPLSVVSFSPADGATGVQPNANIVITFNQFVQKPTTGIGTTANIKLRNSSGIGTVLQTIGINSTSVQVNGAVVTIDPPSILGNSTNVYVVIDASAFNSSGGNSSLINTYDFTIKPLDLGDSYEGGFLICKASPTRWVVAPSTSEVTRNWYAITDASTRAQQVSGCTGWFVPSCGQLQNPGFVCRTYWDSCSTNYWTSTGTSQNACFIDFINGNIGADWTPAAKPVRSFRCVTY